MKAPLRIVIADDELDLREYLVETLTELGHQVVGVAQTGQELLDLCREQTPDLVITDIKMPEMDGIEAASRLYRMHPTPVILISAYHDPGLIERAEDNHVLAYLVKPIKQADLEPAIAIAIRRFEQFEELRHQAADLQQALDDRKTIEKAKGLLMKMAGIDEAAAFKRLQKLASDQNKKLVEAAQIILLAEEVTRPEKKK